jgi:hypothetical protein
MFPSLRCCVFSCLPSSSFWFSPALLSLLPSGSLQLFSLSLSFSLSLLCIFSPFLARFLHSAAQLICIMIGIGIGWEETTRVRRRVVLVSLRRDRCSQPKCFGSVVDRARSALWVSVCVCRWVGEGVYVCLSGCVCSCVLCTYGIPPPPTDHTICQT